MGDMADFYEGGKDLWDIPAERTQSKALTWKELQRIYKRITQRNAAHISLGKLATWAESRTDLFEIRNDEFYERRGEEGGE